MIEAKYDVGESRFEVKITHKGTNCYTSMASEEAIIIIMSAEKEIHKLLEILKL